MVLYFDASYEQHTTIGRKSTLSHSDDLDNPRKQMQLIDIIPELRTSSSSASFVYIYSLLVRPCS